MSVRQSVRLRAAIAVKFEGTPEEIAAFEQFLEIRVKCMTGVYDAVVTEISEPGYGVYDLGQRREALAEFDREFQQKEAREQ